MNDENAARVAMGRGAGADAQATRNDDDRTVSGSLTKKSSRSGAPGPKFSAGGGGSVMRMRLEWLWVSVIWAGCGPSAPTAGIVDAPCYGNGTCNAGLRCDQGTCRRPPPGDCGPVAEALASIELGNYASVDVRAPRVAALRGQCEAARPSEAEAACVAAARTRTAVAACPNPILPELRALPSPDCARVATTLGAAFDGQILAGNLPPAIAQHRDVLLGVVRASCQLAPWPSEVKACMSEPGLDFERGVEKCIRLLPDDVEQQLEEDLRSALMGIAAMPTATPGGDVPPERVDQAPCAGMATAYRHLRSCASLGLRVGLMTSLGSTVSALEDGDAMGLGATCAPLRLALEQGALALGCPP